MEYPKINKKSQAYAIIINNQHFDNEDLNRDGSEKDEKSIKKLKSLNISFKHVLNDLTAEEMVGALKFLATKDSTKLSTVDNGKGALKLLNVPEERIKEYKTIEEIRGALKLYKLESFENYSCLMVFILTHGSKGGVLKGRDSNDTTVEELSEIFNCKECEDLKGKPKIFFIQACRGENEMRVDSENDGKGDLGICKQ